ncbi:ATP-binding protein [Nostoc sp. FACHB-280]|uniref:ATP-binding protein n=1 Tax=Nostoc sp. FACHB-280 TaxID=2692839 RepID=UPI00168B8AFA|nr:ATP-binding protein [Nostoc sp. FACHB-280]MBD2496795.1 ATP-binding protein [Nostoc sp. FACHB-280]
MLSNPATKDWYTANHHYLMTWLSQTRQVIEQHIEQKNQEKAKQRLFVDDQEIQQLANHPAFNSAPPALEQLCQILNLSLFEREIVVLCAGMELEQHWGRLCAEAQEQPHSDYPTFSLALSISSSPYWGALTQDAPLRRWRLIEIGAGNALAKCALRLDEQIFHYLLGLHPLDERLQQIGVSPLVVEDLVPSHQALSEQMVNCWVQAFQENRVFPVLQLCGTEAASKKAIAATACQTLELTGYIVSAQTLASNINQLHLICCLWEREWRLHRRVVFLESDRLESPEAGKENYINQFLETLQAPVIVSSLERRFIQRPLLNLEVHQPNPAEQRQLWHTALSELTPSLNGHIDHLVSHFNLSASAIHNVCTEARTRWGAEVLGSKGVAEESVTQHSHFGFPQCTALSTFLWDTCRTQARPRLDELAQRITATAEWEDLVLPPNELGVLRDIAAHLRQRSKVYEQWGFAGKGGRGLGISALFAGASGTGKTLAAEVLGNALNLDVYRIDLSAVVSKYIGETEKNLRRVFDAAEGGGVILLFDEADALFGKRTEVKDSHDRHANIEVSYLLQRMEAYRGLAILTTNLKASLDQAFLRRIRFIVQFPFPDVNQRTEIWRRVFPQQTPIADLDFQKLAKLNVAGGNIRNIALNAAFLAADGDEPVGMKHLLQAAKSEYIKMERPLTDVEVKGWIS